MSLYTCRTPDDADSATPARCIEEAAVRSRDGVGRRRCGGVALVLSLTAVTAACGPATPPRPAPSPSATASPTASPRTIPTAPAAVRDFYYACRGQPFLGNPPYSGPGPRSVMIVPAINVDEPPDVAQPHIIGSADERLDHVQLVACEEIDKAATDAAGRQVAEMCQFQGGQSVPNIWTYYKILVREARTANQVKALTIRGTWHHCPPLYFDRLPVSFRSFVNEDDLQSLTS